LTYFWYCILSGIPQNRTGVQGFQLSAEVETGFSEKKLEKQDVVIDATSFGMSKILREKRPQSGSATLKPPNLDSAPPVIRYL